MTDPRKAKIRALNDYLRTTFSGGRVMMTRAFAALPENVQAEALARLRTFDAFTRDNDPHGEHDCAVFHEPEGVGPLLFKIDYYDPQLEFGSEAPEDPARTARVLTIMLASDY